MLDVKIAGTDTAQRNSYDGIMLIYYRRLLFFCEAKLSLLDICKCFHLKLYISIIIHVLSCCEVTKNISIIQEKIQNLSHLLTCQLKKGVFSYKYDHFCDFQANKTIKYTLMFK